MEHKNSIEFLTRKTADLKSLWINCKEINLLGDQIVKLSFGQNLQKVLNRKS